MDVLRNILMSLVVMLGCVCVYAGHTINYPVVLSRSEKCCVIHKIELNDSYTEIFFYYRTPYSTGSWINFNSSTTLKDLNNNKVYYVIDAEGIPLSPGRYEFSTIGEGVSFSLKFPRISHDAKYIDIKEHLQDGFHFTIKLESDFDSYSRQYKEMQDYINRECKVWENQQEEYRKRKQVELNRNETNKNNILKSETPKSTRKRKVLKKSSNFKID